MSSDNGRFHHLRVWRVEPSGADRGEQLIRDLAEFIDNQREHEKLDVAPRSYRISRAFLADPRPEFSQEAFVFSAVYDEATDPDVHWEIIAAGRDDHPKWAGFADFADWASGTSTSVSTGRIFEVS